MKKITLVLIFLSIAKLLIAQQTADSANRIFTAVEINASFASPGTIFDFITKNIRYPRDAYKSHIQGKVLVKFTVAINGQVVDAKVLKSVSAELDTEALRVVRLTRWHPAIQNGRRVPVNFTVPITFGAISPASKPGSN